MDKSTEKILLERQDEELIILIKEGSRESLATLYQRYKGLIYEISYKYMFEHDIAQMYLDDLVDVATESLFLAIDKFEVGQEKSFLNFWWAITERGQTRFLQETIEKSVSFYDPKIIENTAISGLLDSRIDMGFDIGISFLETIHKNINFFTQNERIFLEYFILGYKPLEIATFFSWSRPTLYRIKKKAIDKLNMIIKSN